MRKWQKTESPHMLPWGLWRTQFFFLPQKPSSVGTQSFRCQTVEFVVQLDET